MGLRQTAVNTLSFQLIAFLTLTVVERRQRRLDPREKTAWTLPNNSTKSTTPLRRESVARLTKKIRWQLRWSIRSRAFLLRTGRDHPAVLRHYLTDNRRYRLVKLGVLSAAAKHVAEIRAEFEALEARGQFKEKWFDVNIVPWSATFSRIFDRADPVRILEIGSWEGRSTLFLMTYFRRGHLTAVDTWGGCDEYEYNATSDVEDLETRFDCNVSSCGSRITKRKGTSQLVLPQLLDEQKKFDLVYVDGSHHADDVLTDAVTAWRLLNTGGVLIFDDFLWNYYPRWRANPAWAINLFMKYCAGQYRILSTSYQIILQKKVAFTDHAATPPSSS